LEQLQRRIQIVEITQINGLGLRLNLIQSLDIATSVPVTRDTHSVGRKVFLSFVSSKKSTNWVWMLGTIENCHTGSIN